MPKNKKRKSSQARTHAQKDRLLYIDLMLRFIGEVSRRGIMRCFGVEGSSAMRDLQAAGVKKREDVDYDAVRKVHVRKNGYMPAYEYSAKQVIAWLTEGWVNSTLKRENLIPFESPMLRSDPDPEILSVLTRAIYSHRAADVSYAGSEGELKKIIPHSLADSGYSWQVRAYDRSRSAFKSIPISALIKASLSDDAVKEDELAAKDLQWNNQMDLHIALHPDNVVDRAACEAEYALTKGFRLIRLRAAMAASFLLRWNVDCSRRHSLRGPEYRLCLMNPRDLYGIENSEIIPGYEPQE